MPSVSKPPSQQVLRTRIKHALWAFFAGDALSSPTHWFYGGPRQVSQIYGSLLSDYQKPSYELPGSILNKSNPTGGGRMGMGRVPKPSIVGDVILHGKLDLWSPSRSIHYHATLQAGENTLEASLARVLMRSIVETGGRFDADHFRQAYMKFMTTPGSHNDCYASTCHRMFFANRIYHKKDPKDCPDNDGHNVDTIDGLILPTIVALSDVNASPQVAMQNAQDCARVTRNSRPLQQASAAWAQLVTSTVRGGESITSLCQSMAKALGMPSPRPKEAGMTACYMSSAVPAMLDHMVHFDSKSPKSVSGVWSSLLSNANAGGENVHRGSCMGAVLGASVDETEDWSQSRLVQGLYDKESIGTEIDSFVDAVLAKKNDEL